MGRVLSSRNKTKACCCWPPACIHHHLITSHPPSIHSQPDSSPQPPANDDEHGGGSTNATATAAAAPTAAAAGGASGGASSSCVGPRYGRHVSRQESKPLRTHRALPHPKAHPPPPPPINQSSVHTTPQSPAVRRAAPAALRLLPLSPRVAGAGATAAHRLVRWRAAPGTRGGLAALLGAGEGRVGRQVSKTNPPPPPQKKTR